MEEGEEEWRESKHSTFCVIEVISFSNPPTELKY